MIEWQPGVARKALVGQAMWFAGWLGLTLVAAWLQPDVHLHGTHTQLGLPPCPSVILFGRPCPGCGMTTSVTAFVHGQFGLAFRAHPFGPPMYVLYTISAFAALWGWLRKTRMDANTKLMNASLVTVLAAFLVFGVVRFATVSGLQWYYGPPSIKTAGLR